MAAPNPFRVVGLLAAVSLSAMGPLAAQDSAPPGSGGSARALLEQFLKAGADHSALSAALRPTRADCEAVFTKDAAARLFAAYDPAWQQGLMDIKGKAGQTELLLWSATTEDVQAWRGNAREHFPGGYRNIAAQLRPGHTIYVFLRGSRTLGEDGALL